jgi:Voltage gated chloride channel
MPKTETTAKTMMVVDVYTAIPIRPDDDNNKDEVGCIEEDDMVTVCSGADHEFSSSNKTNHNHMHILFFTALGLLLGALSALAGLALLQQQRFSSSQQLIADARLLAFLWSGITVIVCNLAFHCLRHRNMPCLGMFRSSNEFDLEDDGDNNSILDDDYDDCYYNHYHEMEYLGIDSSKCKNGAAAAQHPSMVEYYYAISVFVGYSGTALLRDAIHGVLWYSSWLVVVGISLALYMAVTVSTASTNCHKQHKFTVVPLSSIV